MLHNEIKHNMKKVILGVGGVIYWSKGSMAEYHQQSLLIHTYAQISPRQVSLEPRYGHISPSDITADTG